MRDVLVRDPLPDVDVDRALDATRRVVEAVLGLLVEPMGRAHGEDWTIRDRTGAVRGVVRVDRWADRAERLSRTDRPGHTPLADQTPWAGSSSEALPVATVAIRCRVDGSGRSLTGPHQLQATLHEVGHALNHVLLGGRTTLVTGLDYLPVERLDLMSMWFDKWALHPGFLRAVLTDPGADSVARVIWSRCIEFRRTLPTRVVVAAVDHALHRSTSGTFAETWTALDHRFGIAQLAAEEDVLEHLAWPMPLANPGGEFSMLWAYAATSTTFAPFLDHDYDHDHPDHADGIFSSSVDPTAPSVPVDPVAAFAFHRTREDHSR
ncbi:hypothetical protein AAEP80_03400 [Curtobacterium sp. L3-7]|uniref:hypothetical protein n=1 Tax=Curtobacterium sp. L3-7 TaxID=3138787 RepID=UPI003B51A519